MNKLVSLASKAQHSSFYRFILNIALLRAVPFNSPHNIRVQSIGNNSITIKAKNTVHNRNHIKGIHACLLATMCEYVSGLSLLLQLNPKDYRIILKNISMTYHFQAKTSVYAHFELLPETVTAQVLKPLESQEALFKEFTVEVYDDDKNHICTGLINWQIKAWKHVKLKV